MSILGVLVYIGVIGFILYILRKFLNGPKTPFGKSMVGKIVIITGSNSGIGKTAALELLERGAKVIFACRDEIRTNAVIASIHNEKMRENAQFAKLDLTSYTSIVNFVNEIKSKYERIDILINNAGGTFDTFSKRENIETTIMTNHVGNVILSLLMLDIMNFEGRIINVNSIAHSLVNQKQLDEFLSDTSFEWVAAHYYHFQVYSVAKLFNVYFTQHLDEYLHNNNINVKVSVLHPGFVATEFLQKYTVPILKLMVKILYPFIWYFGKDAEMGAQTTLHVAYIDYNTLKSGGYYTNCHEEDPSELALSKENMRRTMDYTKSLITKHLPQVPQEVSSYFNK